MDRKQCPQCNAWYSSSRGLKIHMGYCNKIDVSKLKSTDNTSHSFHINQHPLLSINTDLFWSNKHAYNNDVYSTDADSQGRHNHDKYPQMLATQMMITFPPHLVLIYQL